MRKSIFYIFLLLICACKLYGQGISRYNTFSYGVNDGLLQTTIRDIEIDKNNFCWISFPNGIQKFDGKNFTNVPVQPGLPDDKMASFFRCANGDLLISHSQGISRYNIDTNTFTEVYKQPAGLRQPVIFIGESDSAIYFYDFNAAITGINCRSYKTVSVSNPGLPAYRINGLSNPIFSDNIINNKVAILIQQKLHLLDLQTGKLLASSPKILNVFTSSLFLKSEHEVIFTDKITKYTFQCWNFGTHAQRLAPIKVDDNVFLGRWSFLPMQDKWLLVLSDRLYFVDSSSLKQKEELVDFQNQPVSGNLEIAQVKEDNFGNLYLQTVTEGIRKVIRNNYTIKYFGKPGLSSNNVLCVLPDKKMNRVLTGGNGGLFIFDTLQHLIKEIKKLPGRNHSFLPNGIIKSPDGSYLIFINSEKQVWKLDKQLTTIKPLSIKSNLPANKSGIAYFGNLILQDTNEAIFQSQEKIYRINFKSEKITEQVFSNEYIMGGIVYGDRIISHGNDELIFLDKNTLEIRKKTLFENTGGVRCFATYKNEYILIGTNKGIFKTDTTGRVLQHWNKETGLPDDCIYAMSFDRQGNLWCSSNKGIFRLSNDNNILQLTREDGLQENEFNTNVMAVAEDGELFFGGVNGVSSFYPAAIGSLNEKVNLLITDINVNNKPVEKNTAVWNIKSLKLSYLQNSLSFDFIAMGNNNPGQYIYQYRMKGIDEHWIQNDNMQTIRYSLPPGKYSFQLYASRLFNKDAKPLKEIIIIITPPFWKTWWFILGAALLGVILLYYSINQRIRLKYARKFQLLENEKQLKEERERISKDLHDSLGVYANAVLYNTELLEKATEQNNREALINELKFASKDIITSLRETVWALKKESYTAEECLVRIRNFIQPLTRYYQQIKFHVEGDAPYNLSFHYTKALNIVRIVQEAVANSIKHSETSIISIHSAKHPGDNRWEIRISDTGKGFVYNPQVESSINNGLINMRQRSAASGFTYSLVSDENNGTIITIII